MRGYTLMETLVGLVFLIVVCVVLANGCRACSVVLGKSNEAVIAQANQWARNLDPDSKVDCAGGDIDGDGYVSCTVFPPNKAPVAILCGNGWLVKGCKLAPRILETR